MAGACDSQEWPGRPSDRATTPRPSEPVTRTLIIGDQVSLVSLQVKWDPGEWQSGSMTLDNRDQRVEEVVLHVCEHVDTPLSKLAGAVERPQLVGLTSQAGSISYNQPKSSCSVSQSSVLSYKMPQLYSNYLHCKFTAELYGLGLWQHPPHMRVPTLTSASVRLRGSTPPPQPEHAPETDSAEAAQHRRSTLEKKARRSSAQTRTSVYFN